VPQIPSLLSAVGQTFWTDMSLDDAPALLALMQDVGTSNLQSYQLTPDVTGAAQDLLNDAYVNTIHIRGPRP
jgi:hypothetical protein